MSLTFKKEERLCSETLIDELFKAGNSFISYPYRIIFLEVTNSNNYPVQVLISVSKKKFKKAVQRNVIKRRMREAYRHLKPELYSNLQVQSKHIVLGLVYIAPTIEPYHVMHNKLAVALNKLTKKMNPQE